MESRKYDLDGEDNVYTIFYKWLKTNNFNEDGIYKGNNKKYIDNVGGYINDIFSISPCKCDDSIVFVYNPMEDDGWFTISLKRGYTNIDVDINQFKNILDICSESMRIDYSDKHEYFPYIKGGNDKKLYIVNLYGDKLVISDKISESISFMDKDSVYELVDRIEIDINVYIQELPMRIKYFRFLTDGFEMILKVYYHKNLNIDLEYIRENVRGKYISIMTTVEEIENYIGTRVDAYITINNKGQITD